MGRSSSLHPRIAELADILSTTRTRLLSTVAGVEDARLGRRPNGRGWSPAQVLDHLARVEASIASLVGKRVAEARASGLRAEHSMASVLHSLDEFRVDDPSVPREASPAAQPAECTLASASAALQSMARSRATLLDALHAGNGLALGDVVHPHPRLGSINLYQWALFVAQHEARHTKQIVAALAGRSERTSS